MHPEHEKIILTPPQNAAAEKPPLLDESILDDVRDLLQARFDDIMRKYLHNSVFSMSQAHSGMARGNALLVAQYAHTLKSSSASLGFMLLARDAEALEDACQCVIRGEEGFTALDAPYDALQKSFAMTRICATALILPV